jgi:hypothetical protein
MHKTVARSFEVRPVTLSSRPAPAPLPPAADDPHLPCDAVRLRRQVPRYNGHSSSRPGRQAYNSRAALRNIS